MKLNATSQIRLLAVVALITLIVGSVFYHMFLKLTWLDAIYFSVITLATVGYGDIVPTTPFTKIFTIFYVLIGIGIIAAFAQSLLRHAEERREKRLLRKATERKKR